MLGNTLAKLIGISRFAIMDYENGISEPPLPELNRIADVLGVELDKLLDDYYKFLNYPYSKKIKQIRNNNNLLQRDLGEMLGVTRRAIERWEHGKNKVTRNIWEKLKSVDLL